MKKLFILLMALGLITVTACTKEQQNETTGAVGDAVDTTTEAAGDAAEAAGDAVEEATDAVEDSM